MGSWGWNHMGGAGWHMGFGGGFLMLLSWAAIVVAAVMLAKWLAGDRSRSSPPRERSALDVLKERYARGEIGRDEFEQKKRDLG